jgi:hypothetical protein
MTEKLTKIKQLQDAINILEEELASQRSLSRELLKEKASLMIRISAANARENHYQHAIRGIQTIIGLYEAD